MLEGGSLFQRRHTLPNLTIKDQRWQKVSEKVRPSLPSPSNPEINFDAQAAKGSTDSLFFRLASRSLVGEGWWAHQDLNLGPAAYESLDLQFPYLTTTYNSSELFGLTILCFDPLWRFCFLGNGQCTDQ